MQGTYIKISIKTSRFNTIRTSVHFLVNYMYINPLKTKCICFIKGLSAYRVLSTLRPGYTKLIC